MDQNLVRLTADGHAPRYDMLDIVREYAAARLQEAGETDDVRRRHALHYLSLAEEAESHLVRTGHKHWFGRLEADRGNLRRGLAWAIDHGETALALRYIVGLWRYWRQLGELSEGGRWAAAALQMQGAVAPSLRAKALCAAAALAFPQADSDRMAELAGEAIRLAHQSEDPMDMRNALTVQGFVAMCRGLYADALEPYTQSVNICRRLGPSWQLATSELNLATALLHTGHLEDAVGHLHKALHLYRELGDDIFAARVLNHLAHAALASSEVAPAESLAREALVSLADQGEPQGVAESLKTLAAVAAARYADERATTLAGAASVVRESIASHAAPFDVAVTQPLLARSKDTMSPSQWQQSWDAGRALPLVAAVEYALTPLLDG